MHASHRGRGAGAALALHHDGHITTVISAPPVSPAAGTATTSQLARVATAVLPSVVTIMVTTSTQSGGSEVIVRSDGTILTNNHVIEAAADGAGTVRVTTERPGQLALPGRCVVLPDPVIANR